jgi:hypothetical protein
VTRSYAWPVTIGAGQDLHLHVSTQHARFGVRLFRAGAAIEEVAAPELRFDGQDLPLGRPDEAWGWAQYRIPLADGLADGIYLAVPVPAGPGGDLDPVPAGPDVAVRPDASLFIVRRAPASGGRKILYKLPTATYTAYNQLGGASLYAGVRWARDWWGQGYVASLQRPGNGGVGGMVMAGDAPDAYDRGSRRQTFAHWDLPFVAWLESRGTEVAYCTDYDLHYDASLLAGDALLLSAGHDEYWSATMRRRVLEFVDRGGNVCFFAGDVACFEVEFSAAGDRLFCPKITGNAPEAGGSGRPGALWHVNDPEDWLTMASGAWGGGWWDGRRELDAYQPLVPTHWAFDGVDIPPEGISGGAATPVIGYETDGVRLERASDPPRLSEHLRGGGGGRVLLAIARLSAGWVAGQEQANAAIMIRTAPSGGMVFSVGTTDWPIALAAGGPVAQITANVVDRLARRALIIRGPVCPPGEYIGDGELIGADQPVTWYVDGGQAAGLGLAGVTWAVAGGELDGPGTGPRAVTTSADGDQWLTITATATGPAGDRYFGSRTVRVAGTDEYLRRRIVRALDALAHPDEQGGALVDQKASEGELAQRVIPVRLGWVQEYAQTLAGLVAELEARWAAEGRMADGALRPDEK